MQPSCQCGHGFTKHVHQQDGRFTCNWCDCQQYTPVAHAAQGLIARVSWLGIVFLCCAFVTLDLHWPLIVTQRVIAMRIFSVGMPDGMVSRIQDAAAMWQSRSVRFALTVDTTAQPAEPGPGTITVGPVAAGGVLQTWHYGGPTGIVACSITVVLTDGLVWHTGTGAPPADAYDMQTAFAHEFGHCLGLNHTDVADGQPVMSARIHTGEKGGWRRVLAPDDIAGRDRLFPPLPVPPVTPVVRRRGCALFGG